MSGKTETIHVRISPGVRMWQVLLVVAALIASLLLGLFIGRASAPPPDVGHALGLQELAQHSETVIYVSGRERTIVRSFAGTKPNFA